MPSIIGGISEEQEELVEQLVQEGKYEDKSDFVEYAVRYTLSEAHGQP